jgi:NAD(P)-dependent dehydrogenase (short-subunit alcohol dehydrogenase family)
MSKIVLITGASSGIGKSTASYLAEKGYKIYAAARRVEKMKDLAVLGIQLVTMDVTDDASMIKGVDSIIAKEGRIDILINNAGFGSYGAVEDLPLAEARYQLEVNVFGAARLIQLVLPHMRRHQWGKIVNISSIGGKMATPLGSWYHASKFAMEGLSDSLRNEVKPFGIDVIVIEPGGVKSEGSGIAMEHLMEVSGNTVYKNRAQKFAALNEKMAGKLAEPVVIAKLIYTAVSAARPKTRYTGGFMAKPLLFLRKVLSDRAMDKLMNSQVK